MNRDTGLFRMFTRGKSQLQLALTTLFVLLLAISSISTLAYTYVQTSNAALHSAWQMMKATNIGVYKDVLRYMGIAKRTSTATAWALKDVRSLRDNRERIFSIMTGQLLAQREVFAISVGDTSGTHLMVAKIFDEPKYNINKSKSLPPEVKYRSHWVDLNTVPKTEYYEYLNRDMQVVDREVRAASDINYDVKTKTWYKEADKKKANAWTDIILYSNGQFGVSNVEPILDLQGNTRIVVSTTIALSLHDGIASRLNFGEHGIAFVVAGDGQMIAYPDLSKITHCEPTVNGAPAKCEFNKISQIGNDPLAVAFEKYKKKSNLSDPANIPAKLNYSDYSAAVNKLSPDERAAFDRAYTINPEKKTILLNPKLSNEVNQTIPDILESIRYTYNMRFTSGNQEYLASFHNFPEHYGKSWMIGLLVPIDDFIGALKSTILQVALISVLILALSILAIVIFSHRILRPLKLIAQDMNRIQNLDIDESIVHQSFFYEISLIANALSSMKHGLKAFSKFVPFTLVKQLIASGNGAELGGEKRHLTMMFTDIAGFTTISESMTTEHLLQHISEYLDHLTGIILAQHGTVDKYIGDAIMSFWGAPVPDKDQEYHSCRAALLCSLKLKELNAKWALEGKPELHTRFGISSGDVSVGNMGSSDRMNYTVLGDAVNLASRLEGINKYYGTDVIVGESTYEIVKSRFCFRPLDVVAVKGKNHGVKIYQLLAESPDSDIAPTQDDLKSQALTEQAFNAYIARDFQSALQMYTELMSAFPDDALGGMFVERCKEYLLNPPPADWDGVTHMKTK